MVSLLKKIQHNVQQYSLWKKGGRIIVAVSGGPDSICLLDVLAKLAPKYKLTLHAAHVNYGLRGKDSGKDEALAKKLAQERGIGTSVRRVRKSMLKNKSEEILRNIRYDFFEKLRVRSGFDVIVLAHTMNDQAETVLMRLIRGSGLQGLSAMQFVSGRVVRPLLNVSREEVLGYLKKQKINYRTDKSNRDMHYLRNRVRHQLLPNLARHYNPNISRTLYELSLAIASDYDYLKTEGKEALKRAYFQSGHFDLNKFSRFHPALKRQLLREVIEAVKSNTKDVQASHINEALKMLASGKSKRQQIIFAGLKIQRKGDTVTVRKAKKS